jgi:hypothetical protein
VGGRGRSGEKGGVMTQTLYVHMNKRNEIKKKNKALVGQSIIVS